jgi:hypothetical protein
MSSRRRHFARLVATARKSAQMERATGLGADARYAEQVGGDHAAVEWLAANDPGMLARIRRAQPRSAARNARVELPPGTGHDTRRQV